MKQIEDYSYEELIKLTDEEVEKIIKLKAANEGIKLLSRPETPTYEEVEAPEIEMFKCAFLSDYILLSKEDADKIMEVFKNLKSIKQESYKSSIGYSYKYVEEVQEYTKDNYANIKTVRLYSPEKLLVLGNKLKSNAILKDNYEKDLEEFEREDRKMYNVRIDVWNEVNIARRKRDKLIESRKRYQEYVELAEGNIETAKMFFEKAYKPTQSEMEEIMETKTLIEDVIEEETRGISF